MNRLGVGDAVGICTNEEGDLVVESNSEEVGRATVRPTYGAAAMQRASPPPSGKALPNGQPLAPYAHGCLASSVGTPAFMVMLRHEQAIECLLLNHEIHRSTYTIL